MKLVYYIENIDCPNCAAKIEQKIAKLDGVEEVSLSYATKKLHLTVQSTEGLMQKLQAAADSVEDGVIFTEKKPTGHKEHHEHCHDDHCHDEHCHCASHEHSHDHNHAHGHSHEKNESRRDILILAVGAALFLAGLITEWFIGVPYLPEGLMLAAYLVMGGSVLLASFRSICKGQVFDENFLMSVATIGALIIGSLEEAAGVMLFFRIGEMFEHLAVERSRRSVMEAIDLRPETALRICGDSTETIPAEEVAIGDLLLVRAGDRIPVDGIVEKGESALDTAAMTGESVPQEVRAGDRVMSGCINLSGVLEIRAEAELGDSMVTRILESVENAAAGKPKIDRFITRFARVYTPIVVAIALFTAIVPSLITGNWAHWVYTALNFLMISCPCALVLSVPLAFFSGIGAGSRKGILFKDGAALEVLAKIRAVVMDKTGTLTNGKFSVTDVAAIGCEPEQLLADCAACEAVSTHPIAIGILEYAAAQGMQPEAASDVQEIAGKGILGTHEGRRIACGNSKLMEMLGIAVNAASDNATTVYVAADGHNMGCITLSDTPKSHAAETVAAMNRSGLHTVMLTGDNAANAETIGKQLGIAEVHAELLPTDKPEYMQKVRAAHGSVLFVGDGINDAPVLSGADVGAAMGSGADAAMEAADIVYLTSDPRAILTSMQIAKRVDATAKINIVFALGIKVLIMLLGFLGFANMWLSVFADTGVTILCVLFVLWNVHFHYRKA